MFDVRNDRSPHGPVFEAFEIEAREPRMVKQSTCASVYDSQALVRLTSEDLIDKVNCLQNSNVRK